MQQGRCIYYCLILCFTEVCLCAAYFHAVKQQWDKVAFKQSCEMIYLNHIIIRKDSDAWIHGFVVVDQATALGCLKADRTVCSLWVKWQWVLTVYFSTLDFNLITMRFKFHLTSLIWDEHQKNREGIGLRVIGLIKISLNYVIHQLMAK